jgi:hypothetical protein
MRGFVPAAEVLLFRQKDPKPFLPGRGPFGETLPQNQITWLRNSLRSNRRSRRSRIWFCGKAATKAWDLLDPAFKTKDAAAKP